MDVGINTIQGRGLRYYYFQNFTDIFLHKMSKQNLTHIPHPYLWGQTHTRTHRHTDIYSVFRDKLSLPRELVQSISVNWKWVWTLLFILGCCWHCYLHWWQSGFVEFLFLLLNFASCSVKNVLMGLPIGFSGEFFFVTCSIDNLYCTVWVTIIVMNTMMIDMHANMRDSKQSGGNVRPDWM